MADQGAIESIAKEMHDEEHGDWCGDEVCSAEFNDQARRLLDALAADGYTVVKTEDAQWEYGAPYETENGERVQQFGSEDAARIYGGVEPVRRRVFPWEPVPEGSEP